MGIKTNQRRRRARGRGLASFVAFVLLFAFALGQGSSLIAFANDSVDAGQFSASNTSEEGTAGEEVAAEDGSAAEEAAAVEDGTDDQAAADAAAEDAATEVVDGGDATVAVDDAAATVGSDAGSSGGSTGSSKAAGIAAAPTPTELEGGDISLDYVAAGPFTYDHATGLGDRPEFGYDNRSISKSTGVVESLEAGDFECGDYVTFFTEVTVDPDAGGGGTIELDYTFGAETTGQPGLGFGDIISVDLNTPDDGNKNLDGNEVVTLVAEGFDSSGYDQVTGTVQVAGLDPGDVVIVRLIAELTCEPGETPTGNILNAIETGRVTSNGDDTISVGQQTVPMKTTGFVAAPSIDIEKTCPAASPFGDDITYTITITNNGNEDLENIVVTDTVDGNAPVDISNLFVDTLLPGESDTADFVYSPGGTEPDPLPNTVEVSATGVFSEATVSDVDTCDTDITHEPGIDVTKSCPADVPFGEAITYTVTVENTGNEPLEGVTVDDSLVGDITDEFDFDFSNPFPVGAVATAEYTYMPDAAEDPVTNTVTASGSGVDSGAEDTDIAACTTDVTHEPGIAVAKSCPAQAEDGETITYTVTVENTGNETLENVTVVDSILGDLSGSFADTLDVGASESHDFDYAVPAGADDLVNVVTASGTGVDSEMQVSDVAECATDILYPAIDIVKTVSEETVPVGTTVTYTYVVTNTGDTTLFDVTVDDDVMGHIGDIAVLEPGESVTLTKDFVVGEEIVINVATARGHDILGRTVSADDDAVVTPIAGENPPEPPTPFTGSNAGQLGLVAIALLGLGVTVVAATRRRRPEPETSW